MSPVAGRSVQDGSLQQLRGKDRFSVSVCVGQVYACTVIRHLHAGCDYGGRIRNTVQQAQFVEEGQISVVNRNMQQSVVQHPHTGQCVCFAADVIVVADNVFRLVYACTQFLQFRRHGQQEGEGVIPGGHLGSVAVEQVVIQGDDKGIIAVFFRLHVDAADNGIIRNKQAFFRVPFNQVVSVDHGTHVHIAAAVSPQVREEVAGQRCGYRHRQLLIIIFNLRRFLRCGFFSCFRQSGGNGSQCHHAYEQICQQFLHSIVPLVHL